MDGKTLVVIAVIGVIMGSSIFGAYKIGLDSGKAGSTDSLQMYATRVYSNGFEKGNSTGYTHGYSDGYAAGLLNVTGGGS